MGTFKRLLIIVAISIYVISGLVDANEYLYQQPESGGLVTFQLNKNKCTMKYSMGYMSHSGNCSTFLSSDIMSIDIIGVMSMRVSKSMLSEVDSNSYISGFSRENSNLVGHYLKNNEQELISINKIKSLIIWGKEYKNVYSITYKNKSMTHITPGGVILFDLYAGVLAFAKTSKGRPIPMPLAFLVNKCGFGGTCNL